MPLKVWQLPPKLLKWSKYSWNLKNKQNPLKTSENDQNTHKLSQNTLDVLDFGIILVGFKLFCSFYRILGHFADMSNVEGYFFNHFRCLGHFGHLRGIKIWPLIDENQQAFKDPLHVLVGPITRARSKKIKEALNGLIQEIWVDSNTRHSKLGPKEDEGVINLIQAIRGWSALIGHDLWRGLMDDWLSSPILVDSHFSYSGAYYFRRDLP